MGPVLTLYLDVHRDTLALRLWSDFCRDSVEMCVLGLVVWSLCAVMSCRQGQSCAFSRVLHLLCTASTGIVWPVSLVCPCLMSSPVAACSASPCPRGCRGDAEGKSYRPRRVGEGYTADGDDDLFAVCGVSSDSPEGSGPGSKISTQVPPQDLVAQNTNLAPDARTTADKRAQAERWAPSAPCGPAGARAHEHGSLVKQSSTLNMGTQFLNLVICAEL